jgi:hypothetical protein
VIDMRRRGLFLVLCALAAILVAAPVQAGAPPKKDNVAPQAPKWVVATGATADSVSLAWDPSHDNKDKWNPQYGVYRDGTLVATVTGAAYKVTGLACAGSFRFEVDAVDESGNRSARAGVRASTLECPPPPPAGLKLSPDGADFAWSHLAATYDGSKLRLFVNGLEVGSRDVGGAIDPTSGPLQIGGNEIWGEWFDGLVDDVRIYNRPLGAAELAVDMATPVASASPAGLVASYSFDTGVATKDLSDHLNNATVEGATWTAAGHTGGAYSFDGLNDYIRAADSASLDLATGVTLEAWVRPGTLAASWRDVIVKVDTTHLAYGLYAWNTDAEAPSAHVYVGGDKEADGKGPLPANACTLLPCASFDRAYHAAKPGDVVELAAGRYGGQTLLFDPSKTAEDVVFRPASGAAVTTGSIDFGPNRFTGGASHVTLQGFTVDGDISIPGCGVPDGTACPVDNALSPGNDLTFRNLRVTGPTAFYCASCSNVSILGGTWGPDTYECRAGLGSSHPEIQSAFAQDKRPRGILIDGAHWQNFARCSDEDHTECLQVEPADDLTIRNSTFRNCDTMGVNIANDLANSNSAAGYRAPNNVLIENNFFDESRDFTGGPTFYALNIRECTNCTIRYNSWLQPPRMPNGEIAYNVSFIGNAGEMTQENCGVDGVTFSRNVWFGAQCSRTDKKVDTLAGIGFVDPASLDLHLKPGSPAIDAGDPASFPVTDIDGDRRPAGAAPDAGADERG